MPPSTLETLTEFSDELLALAHGALEPTVGGTIERSTLTAGAPVFDCEQITVEVRSIGDAAMATLSSLGPGSRHVTGAVNLIGFRITVVRECIAVIEEDGEIPGVAELRADAIKVQQDVWAIWTRVRTAKSAGELFGGRCNKLFFDGARALQTEGGTAGWEIDFRANVPGFSNDGS